MSVDAVVFDWGGTLTVPLPSDLADLWRAAAEHLCSDPGRVAEVAARLAAVDRAMWDDTSESLRSFRLAELLARASGELGLDVTEAVLEEAASRHLDAWTPHIHHDPDAVAVLTALRERGTKIGLLSNTHWPEAFHEHFLARDGLDGLIDVRVYTSDTEHRKPHPAVFRAVLDELGVDPSRAVMVGDRLFDDILGARRTGMRAVLRRVDGVPGHPVEPDATIDALPELLPVVDRWLG